MRIAGYLSLCSQPYLYAEQDASFPEAVRVFGFAQKTVTCVSVFSLVQKIGAGKTEVHRFRYIPPDRGVKEYEICGTA